MLMCYHLTTANMDKPASVSAPSRVAYFTNGEQTIIINSSEEFKEVI